MTLAPHRYRLLTGIEPKSYEDREGGTIELTFSTSRQVKRRMEVVPDQFVEVDDVEPVTIVETLTCETDDEFRKAVELYRTGLGKKAV